MTKDCKWCGTLTDTIVFVFDKGRLVWIGCPNCYEKRKNRIEE